MPKFLVTKGHDAWIKYSTVVDALSAEEAETIAGSAEFDGVWEPCGETEYDHFEIVEVELCADEEKQDEEETICPTLTATERDMIIAALRLWVDVVNDGGEYINEGLVDIATNSGAHEMLDDNAIHNLCVRINSI